MSKSKDNAIDPLEVMDELGTDALRFTLLVGSSPGADVNLSVKKVEANRNFANKIWNAGRFVIGALNQAPEAPMGQPEWTLADRWIKARTRSLVSDVERLFNAYQFGEAGRQIYDFFWGEFADWYLEIAKLQISAGGDRAFYTAKTLVETLDTCLRLLHPFTPFVTESLWGHLKDAAQAKSVHFAPQKGWEDMLIAAAWPEPQLPEPAEAQAVEDFALLVELVRAIRNERMEKKVPPAKRLPAVISAGSRVELIAEQAGAIAALAGLDASQVQVVAALKEKPAGHTGLVISGIEVYLPLSELVDPQAEKARLEKELAEARSQAGRLEGLLSSDFARKAPPAVVDKERQKLAAYQETIHKLEQQLG